jgi:hypothetical protein
MAATPDSFLLDASNEEFNQALEFIRHTNQMVYLTGKAGTGKTTFLKQLKETTTKNMVVVAPTGMAAVNAGGVTIHSVFGIPRSMFVPGDKRLRDKVDSSDADHTTIYEHFRYTSDRLKLLRGMELMVIDEVSMVRCDLLDVVDRLLRVFRKRPNEPFGGVQVVLIGDAFQLPPVVKAEDWSILGKFYRGPFFFNAKVFEGHKPIYLELKKIYRQKEMEFINLLNRVRINEVGDAEVKALNERYDPTFDPPVSKGYVILGTHNAQVERTNELKLQELDAPLFEYEADIEKDYPEKYYPADRTLRLKVGAQVMSLVNEKSLDIFNGTIGHISELSDDRVVLSLPDGRCIEVKLKTWPNVKYEWDDTNGRIKEVILGSFTQYPLRLAWAITVHKSQGQTFEKVIADVGSAFASGQVYVALSRCTSLSGLVLRTPIPRHAIRTDPEVLRFSKEETPQTLIVEQLKSGKADGHYAAARNAFKAGRFRDVHLELLQAVKYRNDIGTDDFTRFCLIHLDRLNRWKTQYQGIWALHAKGEERIRDLETEVDALKDEVLDETTKLERRARDLSTNKKKVVELTKTLENERTEVSKLQDIVSSAYRTEDGLRADVSILRTQGEGLRKEVEQLKREGGLQIRTIRDQSATLQESAKRIKELETELRRVKELTWFDKLLGSK